MDEVNDPMIKESKKLQEELENLFRMKGHHHLFNDPLISDRLEVRRFWKLTIPDFLIAFLDYCMAKQSGMDYSREAENLKSVTTRLKRDLNAINKQLDIDKSKDYPLQSKEF